MDQPDHFFFHLVQQFLDADDTPASEDGDLTDKELFSFFALMILVAAVLALTIGPFSPLH